MEADYTRTSSNEYGELSKPSTRMSKFTKFLIKISFIPVNVDEGKDSIQFKLFSIESIKFLLFYVGGYSLFAFLSGLFSYQVWDVILFWSLAPR